MDAAVYDSVDGFVIGCRGNRLFVCNALTGAILSSMDLTGQFARSNGCLSYDSISNRIFAATWNCPQWTLVGGLQDSQRTLFKLHVNTLTQSLVLDQTFDIVSTFGQGANTSAAIDVGIMAMDPNAVSGNIYCQVSTRANLGHGGTTGIKFSAGNPTSFTVGANGTGPSFGNIVYGSIGGHDNSILPDPQGGPQVVMQDFVSNVSNTFNVTSPRVLLAVGFAPTQQNVFVTDVFQHIYVYATNGTLITTIDTTRSTFNGLCVRYDTTDGNIYIPGGNDNTIAQINPATNALTLVSGFDCPVDYVRAGTTRFAVQAGSIPLRAF